MVVRDEGRSQFQRDLRRAAAVSAAGAVDSCLDRSDRGACRHARRWRDRAERKRDDKAIPAAEFSRIIREFSEEGGYFRSDNLVSNETAYLHVVDQLQDSGISGGAYLGVGPEQNFTYIAKVRPRIAFIVDIRRQAIIQHLMFKALFRLADTRAKFLSLLFSKTLGRI